MKTLKQKAYDLLRWSEGVFKTDMVYLVKNGSWLGFGQIASALISFASALFFANAVSKDLYGSYKYILSVTSILAAISLTGMGTIVTQGVAQGSEGILKDAVRSTLRWSWVLVLVAFTASGYYFFKDNTTLGIAMLVAGASLPISQAFTLYGNYLAGKKDFKRVSLYATGSQALTTIVVIITAITTRSIVAMVIVYFLSTTFTTVWAYIHTLNLFHINDKKDHSLIPYGKHLSVMGLFGTVANQIDDILIFHFLGPINLAIYTFSQAIPEQLKGAFKNLFGLALPKYAPLSVEEMRKSIMKKFLSVTAMTMVIVLAYIVAAPFIFKLLFPKYLISVWYSQIYMISLITIPGISLFGIYFQLRKSTTTLYKLNVIGNATTIIFTFILIYKFGLKGAVIENTASWSVMLLSNWYYFATDKFSREKVLV